MKRLFRAALSARRTAALCLLVALSGATGVYGGYRVYQSMAARTVHVCAVSDFYFRDQKPNWEYQLKLWFAELNRIFEPAGVRWDFVYGGDAYPERTEGDLDTRRQLIADTTTCAADVVLGFTGESEGESNSSVSPFNHTALIATTAADGDAVTVTVIARTLAHLFGVPVNTRTLITTDAPQEGVLDSASLKMIGKLRRYDFSRGISALPGRWEQRAADALAAALAGRSPNPAVEAHRTLGRAYAESFKHAEAIAQFRLAVAADQTDALLRLELAMELNADAQHDAAVHELREGARLDPEDGRPHAAMGAILLNIRRTGEAIEELRIATRLDPRNPEYQTPLGQALTPQVGGAREAASAFEAALRSKPRDESAILGLAQLSAAPQVMQDAVKKAEGDVRQDPNSSNAHLRLGMIYAQSANTDGARREFRRSIELDSRNGQAHLSMAQLLFMAGDYESAEVEVRAAQSNGAYPARDFVGQLNRKLKR